MDIQIHLLTNTIYSDWCQDVCAKLADNAHWFWIKTLSMVADQGKLFYNCIDHTGKGDKFAVSK